MSFPTTLLLGAIAGVTIFIGLPLGRVRSMPPKLRVALAMFSVGILTFIFVDVSSHGLEIVNVALDRFKSHRSDAWPVVGRFLLLAVGFTAGTAGIATVEGRLRRPGGRAPIAGAQAAVLTAGELASAEGAARRAALRTGMTVAVAIGLHNFAEGLAIGVSAKSGAIGLATVLVIGFAMHNATEGFGIVGPLGGVRPSWRWLAVAGTIAGGPTFLGTLVGYEVESTSLELAFYALAGGAIIYVVGEIWTGVRRMGFKTTGLYLLALGFLTGVLTDLIVSYGGA